MQNARWRARRPLEVFSTPSSLGARQMQALDGRHYAAALELARDRGAGQHHDALGGVAQPAGVPNRVAVRAERADGHIQLLHAAVPEVAAVVDDVIAGQLLFAHPDAERVALGRQATALERAEHAVGVTLEDQDALV